MQIFYFKAWWNNLFTNFPLNNSASKLEDPAIIVDRHIFDLQEMMVQSRQAYSLSLFSCEKLKHEHKKAVERRITWRQNTKKYLDSGDKYLADQASETTEFYTKAAAELNFNICSAEDSIVSQKQVLRQLEFQIRNLIDKKRRLYIRSEFAGIQEKLNNQSCQIDAEIDDDLIPEYDFTQLTVVNRGEGRKKSDLTIQLDPDVATIFPDSDDVNEGLRLLIKLIKRQ